MEPSTVTELGYKEPRDDANAKAVNNFHRRGIDVCGCSWNPES